MEEITAGFAVCGSFCTFSKMLPQMRRLREAGVNLIPIMSETAFSTDTRFGKARDITAQIEEICGRKILNTIQEVEPIGPKKLLDILIIEPCTGNTLAKMACGITDTPVTMAAKSHLRNARPVLIAVSTNDALGAAAKNIGMLMNYRNIYFVPMGQDDCNNKPRSMVADVDLTLEAMEYALKGKQLQPMMT